jgi:hypothetical protein
LFPWSISSSFGLSRKQMSENVVGAMTCAFKILHKYM